MKKILTVVASMLICIAMMTGMTVFAEDITSPVEISVASVKDSYIKGDKLTFNVTVKNKIDEAVDAVKLSANISDGYKIVSNQSNAIDLGASEIKTYKITAEENKNGVDSPKTGIGYPVFYIILFVLAVILAFKTRKCKKICSLISLSSLRPKYQKAS